MERRAKNGHRPGFKRILVGTVLVLAFGLTASAATSDLAGTLREAEALLASKQPAQAFALLTPLELDAGGSPYFDYLYGIAALDTGRQAAAITALERVLVREPDFAGARMELARARYEAGDLSAAQAQFEYLLTQSPPPATRAFIDRYLVAISQGPDFVAGSRSRFTPYAEIGAGWDSNANASTGSDTFGVYLLDPKNVETDSPFVELAGGFQHGLAVGQGGALISTGRASYRLNPDAHFVDAALLSLGTTAQKTWGATRASIGGSGYFGWLDGSPHELGAGVDLGLARSIGTNWELASSGRAGIVRFQQDVLEILDVNRYLGSLALTRSGIGARQGRVGIVGLIWTDDAVIATSAYSNERLGVRLFTGWQLGTGSSLFFETAYLNTDFDDAPGFVGEDDAYVDREDNQWTVALSTEYRDWPASGYSLVPTLRYTNTDSTVSLYDYDRFEIGVYLRRSKR